MILCILFWKPSKCDCFPGEIKHSRFVIFFFFFLFSSNILFHSVIKSFIDLWIFFKELNLSTAFAFGIKVYYLAK